MAEGHQIVPSLTTKRNNINDAADIPKKQLKIEQDNNRDNNEYTAKNEPMKITCIDLDCLVLVMKFLNLNDLVNVGAANTVLEKAAQKVFVSKYEATMVLVSELTYGIQVLVSEATNNSRVFGGLTKTLVVNFSFSKDAYWKQTIESAFKTCEKSLTKISFRCCPNYLLELIEKPFVNVHDLIFQNIYFGDTFFKWSDWSNKWFPMLHRLEFVECTFSNPARIEHIPNLMEFALVDISEKNPLRQLNIRNTLFRNPQIRNLKLTIEHNHTGGSASLYSFISRCAPELECLELSGLAEDIFRKHVERIHFRNVTTCTLALQSYITFAVVSVIPFSFDHLQRLTLTFDVLALDELWYDFIIQNKNLVQLELFFDSCCDFTLLEIVKKLPHLVELHLSTNIVSADCINQLVDESKSLLTLKLGSFPSCYHEYLDPRKWKVTAQGPTCWHTYKFDLQRVVRS